MTELQIEFIEGAAYLLILFAVIAILFMCYLIATDDDDYRL